MKLVIANIKCKIYSQFEKSHLTFALLGSFNVLFCQDQKGFLPTIRDSQIGIVIERYDYLKSNFYMNPIPAHNNNLKLI